MSDNDLATMSEPESNLQSASPGICGRSVVLKLAQCISIRRKFAVKRLAVSSLQSMAVCGDEFVSAWPDCEFWILS